MFFLLSVCIIFVPEMRIRCILDAIESFAPRAIQEGYDNSGIQAGDAAKECTGVLLTLDITEEVVNEAIECNYNLIISHHPLLFNGIKQITPSNPTGRILIKAINAGICLYSSHTALDNAEFGVSYRMAKKLEMTDIEVLQPQKNTFAKIAVFTPTDYAEKVAQSLFNAGAGEIGNYDQCCYKTVGTGSYRSLEGANPFIGSVGEVSTNEETRIEVIIPTYKLPKAIASMRAAHPYEEPAFDIIPLLSEDRQHGSGAVGNIQETPLKDLLARLKEIFKVGAIRYCGDDEKPITRIALCGGSGAFLIGDAIGKNADIYITGDIKYHDFTGNCNRIALADIGHYESEQCSKEIFKKIITNQFPEIAVKDADSDINTIKYI